MLGFVGSLWGTMSLVLLAALPSSTNYTLKAFDFGNGGGTTSSTNFQANAITNGQAGGAMSSSTNYKIGAGLAYNINANVPAAPTLTNPSSYYERLHIILNTSGNPIYTRYAIAISSDDFATTLYVQPDNTIGSAYGLANYQIYAAWGGASGFNILSLTPNTSYKVKVRALNGDYSGTAFGPTVAAATVLPTVVFSLATSSTTIPPFNVSFSNLAPGTSVYATDYDSLLTLSTNALFGGTIYLKDTNAGLKSVVQGYTLLSSSANLDAVSSGYGAQVVSTAQTSGGPVNPVSPFAGAGNNVGVITGLLAPILSTNNAVSDGSATVRLKARTNITIPAGNDYGDSLTFVASMVF